MTAAFTEAARLSHAVETDAVFVTLDRSYLKITGRDRAVLLHNFTTNEIKRLGPGQGCEAFLPNIKGRILGHVVVAVEDGAIGVDGEPGAAEFIAAHLDKFIISEDVTLTEGSAEQREVTLFGRQAARHLQVLLQVDAAGWSAGQHAEFTCGSLHGRVQRMDMTLYPGFLIRVAAGVLDGLVATLAGSMPQLSQQEFAAFRIEAGWPVTGVDISEENLAQEAGRTGTAISFTKGCYLGQEPIARLDALGHVNKRLTVVHTQETPATGDMTYAPDGTEIGRISSTAPHPVLGGGVSLAMLRVKHAALGAEVLIGPQRLVGKVIRTGT